MLFRLDRKGATLFFWSDFPRGEETVKHNMQPKGSWKRPLTAAVLALAVLVPSLSHAVSPQQAARMLETMNWYSEEYPPYNFKGEDGLPTGMAVDVLMAAFKKIGVGVVAADIKIAPWNRSYKFIQKRPGTALFSMTYTPERQQIMRFVGPSVPVNVSVIAPKKSSISARTPAELSELRIGVVRDDIGGQLIRKFAVSAEAIKRKNSIKQLLYLLGAGRIDAVAYAADVFNYAVRKSGGKPTDYEEIVVLKNGQLGYAFHRDTDPTVLQPLQKAIDELKAEGVIDKITAKYR